jgi:hypothetical protein
MENSSITIIGELRKGQKNIEGAPDFYEWKTYMTDKEHIILLRAFLKNEIKEVTYNASTEEFADALKRATENK